MSAKCAAHPEVDAAGTCVRCGRFYCAAEMIILDAPPAYCGECGVRPDVDWLGHHFRALEGKRSGLAWGAGVLSIVLVVVALMAFTATPFNRERLGIGLGMLALAAGGLLFFFGHRFGRVAGFVTAVLASAGFTLAGDGNPFVFGASLVLTELFALTCFTDVRSKVFYRVPVPRPALHKYFMRYGNNPLAIAASRLAFASLIVPGLSLVALVMGVIALTKVNSKATPPVTNVSAALGAIFFSLFTTFLWGASLIPIVLRK